MTYVTTSGANRPTGKGSSTGRAIERTRARPIHSATAAQKAGLIGRPVEPCNPYRPFVHLANDVDPRPIRPHDARHGCATLLIAAGGLPVS